MNVQFKTIDEQSVGQRLDNYLLKQLKNTPKSLIYRIIRKGEVRVNKGRKKPDYKLVLSDIVRIPPLLVSTKNTGTISLGLAQILRQNILYEDEGLLVLNKPSGLAVHGGSGLSLGVIEALRQIYSPKLALVHRIDRGTSGCLLIAKKRQVLLGLQAQLQKQQVHKRYWALLKNAWQKKRYTIDAPLLKSAKNHYPKILISPQGLPAVSHFHPLKNIHQAHYSLCVVQVIIDSGRMHQIRLHASYVQHPVVGDEKYGNQAFNLQMQQLGISRLCLHAEYLKFINPSTQKVLKIRAPLEDKLLKKIAKLS